MSELSYSSSLGLESEKNLILFLILSLISCMIFDKWPHFQAGKTFVNLSANRGSVEETRLFASSFHLAFRPTARKGRGGLVQFTGSVPAGPVLQKGARGRKVFFNKQESAVRGLAIGPGGSHRLQNSVVLHMGEYN